MFAHFDIPINNVKHIVVLLDTVEVEYNHGLAQVYQRGIYCFDTKHKAETFTTLCNEVMIMHDPVAYHFENAAMTQQQKGKKHD